MRRLAAAAGALLVCTLASSAAEARSHHSARLAGYHHLHHTWPLTTHYPAWPKSTFFGPRWTGDSQPWYKSDGSAGYGALGVERPIVAQHTNRAQHFASFVERHESMSVPRASFASNGRPRAWCGWFMRQVKGVADASYNLAWNWSHWGHATDGHPGAVAVWHHHVGEVASGSCPAGRIMLHSGNDGNAIRTRCVPLRGAIFREA